ncbi:receptor-like cytosolic serine/threonine-protein kinase RBK2 isoform X2 [Typha angustifolia]|uniref:receptor-like cytosolic serine/threonine-protein kinase RBK2 isoform X2 n=1 Tax=Typha angustifolia TaxID=59011 RepID=UPI003C2C5B60
MSRECVEKRGEVDDALVHLSTSVSAQDLRSLDFDEENREMTNESSSRTLFDDSVRSSDSETVSENTSTSYSENGIICSQASLWRGFLRLWRVKSMRRFSSFPPFGVSKLSRRRSSRETNFPGSNSSMDNDFCLFKPSWKSFTLPELQNATNNFNPENIIGKGGHAEVYKGCLRNGQIIAVKRLTRGTADERINNFLSELGILVHLNHPNTSRLIGVGAEGEMHFVFQLSFHGSLATLLHGSTEKLNWNLRYKIIIGIAKGLEYLHERCSRRIIHRDIKSENILLTEDFEPQICDFGIAKWLPDNLTHHTVLSIEGTFGYLAPEYCTHGIVNEKTDVFAYGVLVLELITGHKALDSSKQSLVMWAKPLLEKNKIMELLDPSLCDDYDSKEVKRVANVARLCVQHSSILRPRMNQVLKLLKGEEDRLDSKNVIQKSLIRRTYSEEIFDAEEYNATRYLNDLSRHKQLAFDY